MSLAPLPAREPDAGRPSQARFTDALLGGRDNYAVDRAWVERVLEVAPQAREVAREHRAFAGRALRLLAAGRGVEQFLDLGSGLPHRDNTHQVVQRYRPGARVVYLDNDPVVLAHGRALLEENDSTHVVDADLTRPDEALTAATKHLDLDEPVGLLMCGVVHHITDTATATRVVREWTAALPAGSYLVLTHHCDPGGAHSGLVRTYDERLRGTELAGVHRALPEVEAMLAGLEPVPPGLVPLHAWWPDGPRLDPLTPLHDTVIGVVAHKP
ncbi:SAM-dependent methyltransferase [Actinokineospora bangkokensis]|uniref:S-adenosyl methyltransferase n=1 Tax=Actinokineospora bangkokensis TaxID=1193682 RepID=A0A1Q9LJ55_9PSEU|nr:SAM-dependent methyltransferase [Actinokineospora bangkokensis]OLR92081.1 hypothetical protein BJP25_22265 [Actinokineospora bangkokensis]